MSRVQLNVLVAARVLLALVFLANGFGIIPQGLAAKELADQGAPEALVPLLMFGARTIEIIGGFGLLLGIYPPDRGNRRDYVPRPSNARGT